MIKSVGRTVDKFFFAPISPRQIGLFRIAYCLILLELALVHLAPDLAAWYGSKAIVPASVAQQHYHRLFPHINLLLLSPETDTAVLLLFRLFMLAIILLLLGVATRLSSLIIFVSLVTLQNQNPYNCNSADALLRLTAFFLTFSKCGDAYSLNRLIRTMRGAGDPADLPHTNSSPWAQRLLQLQLSIVYAHATLSKAFAPDWQSGNAVYFAGRYEEMKRFCLPFFFDVPVAWNFLTWSTIVVEGSLAFLVWFPPLTRWVLLAGLGLHAGIETSMNIPMFQWIMISYYVLFLDPGDVDRSLGFIRSCSVKVLGLRKVLLPYNGRELAHAQRACLLKNFDLLNLIEIGDIDNKEIRDRSGITRQQHGALRLDELVVVSDEEIARGFSAFKQIAYRLPIFWPLVPGLVLPVISGLSRSIFELCTATLYSPDKSSLKKNTFDHHANRVFYVLAVGLVSFSLLSATRSNTPAPQNFTRESLIAAREEFARNELRRTLPLDTGTKAVPGASPAQQLSQDTNLEKSSYHSMEELRGMLNKQTSKEDGTKIVAALRELDAMEPVVSGTSEGTEQQEGAENRWKAVSRLADVYWQDNRLDDAGVLLAYVWEKRANRFKQTKVEDPELLATVLAIAAVRRDAADFAGAEQFFTMAVRYKQRVYGLHHKETLIDKANLALVQYLYGQTLTDEGRRAEKWRESLLLYDEVIATAKKLYPNDTELLRRITANASLLTRDAR